MHYLLAERYKQANDRIQASVEVLARDFDLPDDTLASLNTRHTDLDKTTTYRAEAQADVLERIVAGHKAHKAKLREAKKDAKNASEEADALQSQLSAIEQLKTQVEQLKADNAKLLAEVKQAQTPATVAAPVTPSPVKPAGDQ